jgi:hypothetical protein
MLDSSGKVYGGRDDADVNNIWYLQHSILDEDDNRGWMIRSNAHNQYLACDGDNTYTSDQEPTSWEAW